MNVSKLNSLSFLCVCDLGHTQMIREDYSQICTQRLLLNCSGHHRVSLPLSLELKCVSYELWKVGFLFLIHCASLYLQFGEFRLLKFSDIIDMKEFIGRARAIVHEIEHLPCMCLTLIPGTLYGTLNSMPREILSTEVGVNPQCYLKWSQIKQKIKRYTEWKWSKG